MCTCHGGRVMPPGGRLRRGRRAVADHSAPGRPIARPMGTRPATTSRLLRRTAPDRRRAGARRPRRRAPWGPCRPPCAARRGQRRSRRPVRGGPGRGGRNPGTAPPGAPAWACRSSPRPTPVRPAAGPAGAGNACRRPCSARRGGAPVRPTRRPRGSRATRRACLRGGGVELLAGDRVLARELVAAQADAERESAAAEPVERRRFPGHLDRPTSCQWGDHRPSRIARWQRPSLPA